VSFARGLSSALGGVTVTGRDLITYTRIKDLAAYLYTAVEREEEARSVPVSAEMQLMVNMEPLTGLRAMVILQVFWYHWHSTWPTWAWPFFGRCLDMEIFFAIMGVTAMIQNRHRAIASPRELSAWLWTQWWKIFPMYWLALGITWWPSPPPDGH
jgi:hypothetical protein